ncbi:helix-turn-helix transcriptional regulator [Fibrella aquatica]|uniref:helix-turn-helix transcriptional regulator n=1 Tax=Fibrella aquatica TaxID=3242487 RepID=UPI0035217BBF
MKKNGSTSDTRLRRIFEIHKALRQSVRGKSAKELCVICQTEDDTPDERTIANDIKFLRDMGAPLPDRANKYEGYYYKVPYSLLEALDDSYMGSMNEALALLRQLSKSTEFIGLEDLLLRLEQRVALTSAEHNPIIEFDEAELTGRQHLIGLYNATLKQTFLRITYQTFQGEEAMVRHIFPLLLKQYNNRWVLVGWESGRDTPQNLPLDRIVAFHKTAERFVYGRFDSRTYFRTVLGTTRTGQEPQEVVLHFSSNRGKYIETKKIHPNQKTAWLPDGRLEVKLCVELNRELEARILEFGKDVVVMEPSTLRDRIKENLKEALSIYNQN